MGVPRENLVKFNRLLLEEPVVYLNKFNKKDERVLEKINHVHKCNPGLDSVNRLSIDYTGNRIIFAGGEGGFVIVSKDEIMYYHSSSFCDAADFGNLTGTSKNDTKGTDNKTRGVFVRSLVGVAYSNVIEYITISSTGNATDFGDLIVARSTPSACSNKAGNRAVFGYGGWPAVNVMDYITISTTGNATDFGDMTYHDHNSGAATSSNNVGHFAGGQISGTSTDKIDYIVISTKMNATDFGDLTVARENLAATSSYNRNRGIYAGGNQAPVWGAYDTIDYVGHMGFKQNAVDFGDLRSSKTRIAAESDNIRGFFAGGGLHNPTGDSYSTSIDFVIIDTLSNAYGFSELSEKRRAMGACSDA